MKTTLKELEHGDGRGDTTLTALMILRNATQGRRVCANPGLMDLNPVGIRGQSAGKTGDGMVVRGWQYQYFCAFKNVNSATALV